MDLDADPAATLAEVGEQAVLEVLRGPSTSRPAGGWPDPLVDNGDDAAVLGPAAATVMTTDTLVEGTHFRMSTSTPEQVGRRAVAQNVSDVMAMGADCAYLLVAVVLPPTTTVDAVAGLAAGLHGQARLHGARVIGGDLTSGPVWTVTVTAVGLLPAGAEPVRLGGGRVGDVVALTGRPGRAAAGLELIGSGRREGELQDLHRVPRPPVGAGTRAREAGARALTDVSDGLARDLSTLARHCGCAAELRWDALAGDPLLAVAADALAGSRSPAGDPDELIREWVLDGGEDHGLVGAFDPGAELPADFAPIGRLLDGPPGTVLLDGRPLTVGGWDSTRSPGGTPPGGSVPESDS